MSLGLKSAGNRVALVVFGIGAALLVVEAALQLGAMFVGGTFRDRSWATEKRRVLCLGDSNTYGVYVDRLQAYPKVFEALWNAEPGKAPIEVLNLGYPGTNSSKLVKDMRRMLWAFRPDMVVVMIGVNDFWTVPETAADSPNVLDRVAAALWRVSRAYRLLYIARKAVETPTLEVSPDSWDRSEHGTARYGSYRFELGWRPVREGGGYPRSQLVRNLESNLMMLAKQARDFGAQIIFLTYPADSSMYGIANFVIRDAARKASVPLVDLAAGFKAVCGDNTCPELLPDQHPSASGHERAARILVQQLMPSPGMPR
ncbi:MAG: SGNH/GDSL hydrolase family protein [Candidatus Binatia bacterium]